MVGRKSNRGTGYTSQIIILFCLIIALPALSQSKQLITGDNLKPIAFAVPGIYVFSGQNIKLKTTTDITVAAGTSGSISLDDSTKVYQFIAANKGLTLNYSVTGVVVPPVPVPVVIEAESTTSFSGLNTTGEPNVICCIQPGSYAAYPITFTTAKTKLTVLYSRGSAGNGTVVLRTGSQTGAIIATLSLPTTGAWSGTNAFKTAIFTIPSQIGAKVLYFTNPNAGECNPDKYTFE